MSSHSVLRAGPFVVESTKDEIEPGLMALFVPSDKQTRPMGVDEWVEMGGDEEGWDPSYAHVHYICSVTAMKDRLDLLGFTIDAAAIAFTIGVERERCQTEQAVETYNKVVEEWSSQSASLPPKASGHSNHHSALMLNYYVRKLEALKILSLENWLGGMKEIRRHGLVNCRLSAPEDFNLIIEYILELERIGWGYPGLDVRFLLRLLLEVCEPCDYVDYNLTELIIDEVFESSADMVAYAEYLITREQETYRRIIVLTEGASDKWILERSLKLLHPHLSEFFSFMDFDGARIEGGAGALSNLVKAFAGAGISNRVIALFDNDTAGRSAMQSLAHVALPENIAVLILPRLGLAEHYPTQGPTGISVMDINGLACSLELYLGHEILTTKEGTYRPIEWRGLDTRLRQYQGEILEKRAIQELFRSKLEACERDASAIARFDWAGLELVLASLRRAFQEYDSDRHLEAERWYENEE